MDLKYLTTFRTVVDAGGFSKAAAKLNYSQSAITFQIDQLERELSVPLFEKIGRRMVLTKAGEQLLPHVDAVLESVDRMRGVQDDLESCRGTLRVGVAESFLCYLMPPVLKELHLRAPNAQVLLQSLNCYDVRDGLLAGELDLGVFSADVGGFGSMLVVRELGRHDVCLVASPRTAAEHPGLLAPDAEVPVPFVTNETRCVYRQMLERSLRDRGTSLSHVVELWSIPTIKNLVKNDMGFTFLPRYAVEDELRSGELVELHAGMDDAAFTAACCWHKGKWTSPLMSLFAGLCESAWRDGPKFGYHRAVENAG